MSRHLDGAVFPFDASQYPYRVCLCCHFVDGDLRHADEYRRPCRRCGEHDTVQTFNPAEYVSGPRG